MKLSPRLMAIVSLCSESECYADIGTDHAFIPIYLAQKNLNSKIYASDLRKG
ncbi:MAG: SAM-dependent methyltransferase, partial [Clostridiales bacterium]|nr:SAM-dependent methyltransferase [Clostridiales bacterium]